MKSTQSLMMSSGHRNAPNTALEANADSALKSKSVPHSTVTLLAKFRGLSTSQPRSKAM